MARRTNVFTLIAVVIIAAFIAKYALEGRWALVFADGASTLIGITFFRTFMARTNQDDWSYAAFLAILVLHVAYLYPHTVLGIRWDRIQHFLGGIAIALIADRLFAKEYWSIGKRLFMICIVTLGIGALHEILEWAGYAWLGEGEGFLMFGAGDEGEWRDAVIDMLMNLSGAALTSIAVLRARLK